MNNIYCSSIFSFVVTFRNGMKTYRLKLESMLFAAKIACLCIYCKPRPPKQETFNGRWGISQMFNICYKKLDYNERHVGKICIFPFQKFRPPLRSSSVQDHQKPTKRLIPTPTTTQFELLNSENIKHFIFDSWLFLFSLLNFSIL